MSHPYARERPTDFGHTHINLQSSKTFQRRLGRRLGRRLLAWPLPGTQANVASQHLDRVLAPRILALLGNDLVAWCEIALGLDALLELAFVIQRQAVRLDRLDLQIK